MKLIMDNNFLAVKEMPRKEKTKSGIILPDKIEEDGDAQTSHCKVIATHKDSKYKIGDTVLFSKLVPDDVWIEDENEEKIKLWFVKESDIKAKLVLDK